MTRFAFPFVALVALASCGDASQTATTPPSSAPGAATAPGFALAFVEGGRAHVVVDREPELTGARGAPHTLSVEDPVVVERAPSDLGQGIGWLGRRVRLYGSAGPVCEGVVREVTLVGRVSPHEGTLDRLRGKPEEGEAALTAAEIADEAWSLAADSGGVVLAGEVDAAGCDGAIWAGLADAPVPAHHPSEAADAETEARFLAAFRALPEWAAVQARYDEQAGSERAPRWDSHGESRPTVNVVDLGTSRLVVVTADVGDGCGDFAAAQTVVFREDARGTTLVGAPVESGFVPTVGVDVDGDGAIDLVLPNGVRRAREGAFEHADTVEVPFLGCPC